MPLFDRRHLMKLAGAAPLLTYIAAQDFAEKTLGAVGKMNGNIYSRLGVRSFINGRGTWTYLSGSLELPEVRAVKQAAAEHFVEMTELQHAVGRRLAELTGVPGVKTEIQIPEEENRYPTLVVSWDKDAWGFTVDDCDKKLREGDPRIELLTSTNRSLVPGAYEGYEKPKAAKRADLIEIVSMTLQPGEDLIVGRRLRQILNEARKKV